MGKKKVVVKKKRISSKIRIFFSLIVFVSGLSLLSFNFYQNIYQVKKLHDREKDLNKELTVLNEQGEVLESDIKRLNDPDYIAKYVREKYLYSKEGELIIRMDDDN